MRNESSIVCHFSVVSVRSFDHTPDACANNTLIVVYNGVRLNSHFLGPHFEVKYCSNVRKHCAFSTDFSFK